jgi:hypothetical protein
LEPSPPPIVTICVIVEVASPQDVVLARICGDVVVELGMLVVDSKHGHRALFPPVQRFLQLAGRRL